MYTLPTGGHMKRAYMHRWISGRAEPASALFAQVFAQAKPAVIASMIMVLAASSTLAAVTPSVTHAAPKARGEKAAGAGSTVAQSAGSSLANVPGRPLAELMNPDGTVNLGTGFSGTLDMA